MRCAWRASATRTLASRYSREGAAMGCGTSQAGGAIQAHAQRANTSAAAMDVGTTRDLEAAGWWAFFLGSSMISVTIAATSVFDVGRAGVVITGLRSEVPQMTSGAVLRSWLPSLFPSERVVG